MLLYVPLTLLFVGEKEKGGEDRKEMEGGTTAPKSKSTKRDDNDDEYIGILKHAGRGREYERKKEWG